MADTIPVVVGQTEESAPQTLGLGDVIEKQIAEIDADTLRKSLTGLSSQLGTLFQDIKNVGGFKLSQVQVSLEISAEGGVALIGTAKAGARGAINLTFSPE
jgi:hypothetical protein